MVDPYLAATQMRPTSRGGSEEGGRTKFHSRISPGSLPLAWPTAAGDDLSPHLQIFALREWVPFLTPLPCQSRSADMRAEGDKNEKTRKDSSLKVYPRAGRGVLGEYLPSAVRPLASSCRRACQARTAHRWTRAFPPV